MAANLRGRQWTRDSWRAICRRFSCLSYTTKSEGTFGLGLAVVQKIALQHGGSIEARNRPGNGAELLLWLPLRQALSPSLYPSEAARI